MRELVQVAVSVHTGLGVAASYRRGSGAGRRCLGAWLPAATGAVVPEGAVEIRAGATRHRHQTLRLELAP